jgi:hypothetical protein
LPEHLKNYHKTWTDNRNEENSIEMHSAAYNDIRALLGAPISIPPIPVAQPLTLDQEIHTTRHIAPAPEVSDWHVGILLGNHMTKQTATELYYGERPPPPPKKRKAPTDAQPSHVAPKKRKQRMCVTCKRSDCQGAFRSKQCQHSHMQASSIVISIVLCSPRVPYTPAAAIHCGEYKYSEHAYSTQFSQPFK